MPRETDRLPPQEALPSKEKEIELIDTSLMYAGQAQNLEKLRKQIIQLRKHPTALAMFRQIDSTLRERYPDKFHDGLSTIISKGDENALRRNQQLIVLTNNLACTSILEQQKKLPQKSIVAVSGQSLGFVSAMHTSGAIDVSNLVCLGVERQEAMWKANEENPGTLGAFFASATDERIEQIKQNHDLETSIETSTELVVLGGGVDEVKEAVEEAKDMKVKAVSLETDGAFHTSRMQPAAERLERVLEEGKIEINDAQVPIFPNSILKTIHLAPDIAKEVIDQLTNQVLWLKSKDAMAKSSEQFIEIGNEGLLTDHIIRDLERRTGQKGVFKKRHLLIGGLGLAAVTIGTVLVVRHIMKNKDKS